MEKNKIKESIINEPIEMYFKSPKFISSYKRIQISTQEEQEADNLSFSNTLSPAQRLEYMNFLNRAFLPNYPDVIPASLEKKINFENE